jgi:hypothetical protein
MELNVRVSGSTYSYTDVELAEGELVRNKKLGSSGGREQLENGDIEVALYGSFAGYETPDAYLDDLSGGFSHLRAQLKDPRFGVTFEGSIYEGDLGYDEVDDKWIVLLLGDAEEELRSRLRKIDIQERLNELNDEDGITGSLRHKNGLVFTSGAPPSEGTNALWHSTLKHKDGNTDNAILSERAGWQSIGRCRFYKPSLLLEQMLPSSVTVSSEHTSAHATNPTTGTVPIIEKPEYTYTAEDGTETDVSQADDNSDWNDAVQIFSVRDWSEPRGEGPTGLGGFDKEDAVTVPNWTGEELLDYYLTKTGRRLIATYQAFPSETIELVFADDTTDLSASGDLDSAVPEAGLATGDPREQGFYEADMERPRLPDLAVQAGPIFGRTQEASGFGRAEHLDLWQIKMNRGPGGDSVGNDYGVEGTPTPWYSPSSIFLMNSRKVWRLQLKTAYGQSGVGYSVTYVPYPPPPKAKYCAQRWGAGRETKIVEENESVVQLQTRPCPVLAPCDAQLHERGRTGPQAIHTNNSSAPPTDSNHFGDSVWDPWRDPAVDNTRGVRFAGTVAGTADEHRYGYECRPITSVLDRLRPLNFRVKGGEHGTYALFRLVSMKGSTYNVDTKIDTDLTNLSNPLDEVANAVATSLQDDSGFTNGVTHSGADVVISVTDPVDDNDNILVDLKELDGPALVEPGPGSSEGLLWWDVSASNADDEIVITFTKLQETDAVTPTQWDVKEIEGYPVIPYESDQVWELTQEQFEAAEAAPNALLWKDLRRPGTTDIPYDQRDPADIKVLKGFGSDDEAVQYANTEGIAKANSDPNGVAGLVNPTWARYTWERREASTSPRIVVTIEADISDLEFEVGDPNRALSWRGYTWLVTAVEQQADRPIATLTLERYADQPDRAPFAKGSPSIAPPRNVTLQKTLIHELRKKNDNSGDLITTRNAVGDDIITISWDHPAHEDQGAVWYYEVQGVPITQPAWWRWFVTTGTLYYGKTWRNQKEFIVAYRVRAVGFPDGAGEVETSDFVYPTKQETRVLRSTNIR